MKKLNSGVVTFSKVRTLSICHKFNFLLVKYFKISEMRMDQTKILTCYVQNQIKGLWRLLERDLRTIQTTYSL